MNQEYKDKIEQEINLLVYDFTKTGSMPKSEVKRQIEKLLNQQMDWIRENIESMKKYKDKKEIWCPYQKIKIKDYWSHHDEGLYCENCGRKVEIRIIKELDMSYEIFETLDSICELLSSQNFEGDAAHA